jgi:hypothetical protein
LVGEVRERVRARGSSWHVIPQFQTDILQPTTRATFA